MLDDGRVRVRYLGEPGLGARVRFHSAPSVVGSPWEFLGEAEEVTPGQYQVFDTGDAPMKFYRLQ
jgi:hypothetical protein